MGRVAEVLTELRRWMEEREYESVSQLVGCMSQTNVADPDAFTRANYMKMLDSYKRVLRAGH